MIEGLAYFIYMSKGNPAPLNRRTTMRFQILPALILATAFAIGFVHYDNITTLPPVSALSIEEQGTQMVFESEDSFLVVASK